LKVVLSRFSAPFCVALGEVYTQRKVVIVGSVVGFVMVALSSFLIRIEFFIFFYGVGTGKYTKTD
jgi:hypothetical protein